MSTPDWDQLFPSRFLKSGEFKGKDVTLVIRRIRTEELPDDKGGARVRGVIGFDGTKKELVLNRTNGECIKGMFGRDTSKWIGKRVTLFPAPFTDPFTGEVGTAIRVRGSPDLTADQTIEVKLPKKRPISMTMKATGQKGSNGKPKGAAQVPVPVTAHGEPPPEVQLPGQTVQPDEDGLPFEG